MASHQNKDAHFCYFKEVSESEKHKILLDRNSEGTQAQTKLHLRTFCQFLLEKNLCTNLSELKDEQLPKILEDFYVSLQRKDTKEYKLQSLKCIRAGLNHYFKEERSLDIIANPAFMRTNEIF